MSRKCDYMGFPYLIFKAAIGKPSQPSRPEKSLSIYMIYIHKFCDGKTITKCNANRHT